MGHSTEHAALDLVDRIVTQMDKNETPINIFLDLSKAFDTIDHKILIDKLNYYGLDDNALHVFRSYLTSRTLVDQHYRLQTVKGCWHTCEA